MNNMSKIIKGHSKKVTSKPRNQKSEKNLTNCRKKADYPMEGNCQINDVVCKCHIARLLLRKVCLGLTDGEWKSRFCNHNLSFKYKRYSNKQHFQVTCGT